MQISAQGGAVVVTAVETTILEKSMFVVFHMRDCAPHAKAFNDNEMSAALTFCEDLRQQRREGAAISHVTMSSELDASVGQAGVADPSPDYNWKKRRA